MVDWMIDGTQMVAWLIDGTQMVDWLIDGTQMVDWLIDGTQMVDWDPGDADEGEGGGRTKGRAQQAQGRLK